MTPNDRHNNSDDLPEFLHDIAADASDAASDIDDDAFADAILKRGRAHRRKRLQRNTLVAAACLAVVAVVGAATITNLPGLGGSKINVADDPYGLTQCGARVTDDFTAGGPRGSRFEALQLVSEEHSTVEDDGTLTPYALADQDVFLTNEDSEPFLSLLLANVGTDRVDVGALGPAKVVLVKDGVVVTRFGEAERSPVSFSGSGWGGVQVGTALPVPCEEASDDSQPPRLPEGEYEAYGVIEVGSPALIRGRSVDEELSLVHGGPWKVRIGEPEEGESSSVLECGDPADFAAAPSAPVSLRVIPQTLDGTDEKSAGAVVVEFDRGAGAEVSETTVKRLEWYMIDSAGLVRSSAVSDDLVPLDWSGSDTVALPSTTVSDFDCLRGAPLASGDYDVLVIATVESKVAGKVTEFRVDGERTPMRFDSGLTDPLPDFDPTATFPACGAPVLVEDGEFELVGDPEEFPVERDADGTALAPIEEEPESWPSEGLLLNSAGDQVWGTMNPNIGAVFVKDGRVVGALTQEPGDEQEFMALPGGHVVFSYVLNTGLCGPEGTLGQPLPAGTYEVWGSMDVRITERKGPDGKTRDVDEEFKAVGLLETVKFTD